MPYALTLRPSCSATGLVVLLAEQNEAFSRSNTATKGHESPQTASSRKGERCLVEIFEICKSEDSNDVQAWFACADQRTPESDSTTKRAKPSLLPIDATHLNSATKPSCVVYEVYKELRDACFQAVPGPREDLRAGREPSWLDNNNNVTGNNIMARRQGQSARRQEQSRQPPRPRLYLAEPEPRDTARNKSELWELLQTAIRSGHVVLVGAEDTWKDSCASPGQQVQLRGDALYKCFASILAAVAQLTSSLFVRRIFDR